MSMKGNSEVCSDKITPYKPVLQATLDLRFAQNPFLSATHGLCRRKGRSEAICRPGISETTRGASGVQEGRAPHLHENGSHFPARTFSHLAASQACLSPARPAWPRTPGHQAAWPRRTLLSKAWHGSGGPRHGMLSGAPAGAYCSSHPLCKDELVQISTLAKQLFKKGLKSWLILLVPLVIICSGCSP